MVPTSGRVTITGTVTNTSDETWIDVKVYPVLPNGSLPMTTTAELEAAALAPPDLVIGERYLPISDDLGDLPPGGVAPYALRVPRSQLPDTEGVHWLGVHALGGSAEGRDAFSDGRARTFLPRVRGKKQVPTALVMQLRNRVQHASDGRVDRIDQWATTLGPEGRLHLLAEMGAAAGDRPVTWLVDPAVIGAVTDLVAGNPERLPPPTDQEGEPEGEEAEPSGSPSPTDGLSSPPVLADPVTGEPVDPSDPVTLAQLAVTGQDWLARLRTALSGKELLALPYGDVDASAASHLDPQTVVDAQTLSATEMAGLGLPAAPALASPSGYLHPDAIDSASPDTTLLVTSDAVSEVLGNRPGGPTSVVDVDGHEVVLSSAGAVAGGPGPDDRIAPVAFRQRILAEAAVRALGDREPLVVTIPTPWVTSEGSDFFSGLDADFVDLAPLSQVAADADERPLSSEDLAYPVFQQKFELDAANFTELDELVTTGSTLQQVLAEGPDVESEVRREAYAGVSYWQRPRAGEARASLARSAGWIRSTLGRITIDSPVSVTLSSATGQFPARLHNGLDRPVVVRVGAEATGGLTLELPDEVALAPGETTRLRLSATAAQGGSHTVRLFVSTVDGTPTGAATELPIRSNQVSQIIWIVIVAGGGLLFGAIGVRLFRRLRGARGRPPEAA
ncbi:DUF6049 family protein [Nocardioides bigeumensis]|uniref:DUF6049 family protein n=1 Tax=Nocardioides bigeumensis TaxID=433657 RepID=A0ABP5KSP3_9ACTN